MITDTSKTVRGITVDNDTMKLKASNGLPAGGTTDQILAKNSNNDYDTKWVDAPSGGSGGSGEKLYQHNILLNIGGRTASAELNVLLTVISSSNEIFTLSTLESFLYDNTYEYTFSGQISASGYLIDNGQKYGVFGFSFGENLMFFSCYDKDFNNKCVPGDKYRDKTINIYDKVIEC